MTLVVNKKHHPVDVDGGDVMAPGEEKDLDLTSPFNNRLVTDGVLALFDSEESIPPPVPSPAFFRRIASGVGAESDAESVIEVRQDGDVHPRFRVQSDGSAYAGGDGASPAPAVGAGGGGGGGVTANVVRSVIHNNNPNVARPASVDVVIWVGAAAPVNSVDNDLWAPKSA